MTKSLIFGFTGTRQGMTMEQKCSFRTLVGAFLLTSNEVYFKHGDCLGADADADRICRTLGVDNIFSYPCNLDSQRAYTGAKQMAKPAPPRKETK